MMIALFRHVLITNHNYIAVVRPLRMATPVCAHSTLLWKHATYPIARLLYFQAACNRLFGMRTHTHTHTHTHRDKIHEYCTLALV
jgi:hypothetical protein